MRPTNQLSFAEWTSVPDVDLTTYDFILLNTSGGKDSQVMVDEVFRLAVAAGVNERLVAVHCDLGRVEWAGKAASNKTRRHVDEWLPIHHWTTDKVWARIRESGVPHHFAYDLGMPRLSCVFCIFAPREALLIGGQHNPELLADYVGVEQRIGHTFRQNQTLIEIQTALAAGERPKAVTTWALCA